MPGATPASWAAAPLDAADPGVGAGRPHRLGRKASPGTRPSRLVAARRQRRLGALVLADAALPKPAPRAGGGGDAGRVVARAWASTPCPGATGAAALRRRVGSPTRCGGPGLAELVGCGADGKGAWRIGWGPHLAGNGGGRSDPGPAGIMAQILANGAGLGAASGPLDAAWRRPTIPIPTGRRGGAGLCRTRPSRCWRSSLQELFVPGRDAAGSAAGGCRSRIHMLSPAGRPLPVTRRPRRPSGLAAMPSAQRRMPGRYPRHPWPDGPPWPAPATARAKRAGPETQGAEENDGGRDRRRPRPLRLQPDA